MSYRNPDFDLRPRRLAPPMPMLSTMQVDDDDDLLDALAATTVARWERNTAACRDARHIALAALPSTLCTPAAGSAWTGGARRTRARARWRPEGVMVGSIVSAALALLVLVAAMMWRLERPRVVYEEGTAPAIATSQPEVDAISSASP